MLKNYLRTAMRFLKQNKVFAGINALGLSIALAASFIILLFVINELSFDNFNKNSKRTFRVLNFYKDFNNSMTGTPYILASEMKKEFPQVERAVNIRRMRDFKLKLKDEYLDVRDAQASDSDIFRIFTIPLILGPSDHNLLTSMNSIVLSESTAKKFFPGQNPIGKEITGMANNEEKIFIVEAVFDDIPENSTLKADCFLNSRWTIPPIDKLFNTGDAEKNWTYDFWITWILISNESNSQSIENQFNAFEVRNISEKPHNHYFLQNLSDAYLGSDNINNPGITGNIKNVKLFSAIAFLILLVAAINYIILSTAVSSARSKEIGIRKTFGAGSNDIKNQLFSESVLLAVLVLPLSLILTWLALPLAGKLFQTHLVIISSNVPIYITVYLLLTILIGVASGIYTSSYLSRLKILEILRNTSNNGKRRFYLRSSLIVIQLVIFCAFVSGTLIIRSQYNFALKKDPGYYNKDILLVELGRDFKGYSSYINNIKSHPDIINAAGVMAGLPMQGSMSFMYPSFQDKTVQVNVEGLDVDYNFLKTMGITILQGRDFSEEYGSDLAGSCLLNETAVKRLGINDPLNNKIGNQRIIGIVKDFNLHSIHTEIPTLMIAMTDKFITQVAIHYKPGTLNNILPLLETEWKKAAPDRKFMFSTIEDLEKDLYSTEKNLTVIVSIFALFTLIIAAFGLFGLTLFIARSRTKEIGIKKVFGSHAASIVYSFLRDNFVLVVIATAISIPVTIYFMVKWLSNFAYKASISWTVFFAAFLISAIVVLLTVSLYSFKAARTNPVEALKYE